MRHPFNIFIPRNGWPCDAVLIIIPLAKWQVSANDDKVFTLDSKA
jgi:hypothetical protein